ncbi:MAG: response regulator transcription factor [Chloroflexota bacterium]|jgi:two-component system KDP operon response regulator KdpE
MNWEDKTVLIIDDEPAMCQLIMTVFAKVGAKVHMAFTGEQGLDMLIKHRPDLVILDILLPGIDGLEVCRQIRDYSEVPIVVLTAVGPEEQVVNALQAGADDYITKPFRTDELRARAMAIMRRAGTTLQLYPVPSYQDDYLTIDLDERRVLVRDDPVKLTSTEFKLLAYLYRHADNVCTFEQILDNVWSSHYRSSAENVHVYIWHLRQKLEEDPKNPTYLISDHSVGYRFQTHDQE